MNTTITPEEWYVEYAKAHGTDGAEWKNVGEGLRSAYAKEAAAISSMLQAVASQFVGTVTKEIIEDDLKNMGYPMGDWAGSDPIVPYLTVNDLVDLVNKHTLKLPKERPEWARGVVMLWSRFDDNTWRNDLIAYHPLPPVEPTREEMLAKLAERNAAKSTDELRKLLESE